MMAKKHFGAGKHFGMRPTKLPSFNPHTSPKPQAEAVAPPPLEALAEAPQDLSPTEWHEEDVLEEDVLEEDVLEEDVLEEDALEEDIPEEDILEEDVLEEDIPEEDHLEALELSVLQPTEEGETEHGMLCPTPPPNKDNTEAPPSALEERAIEADAHHLHDTEHDNQPLLPTSQDALPTWAEEGHLIDDLPIEAGLDEELACDNTLEADAHAPVLVHEVPDPTTLPPPEATQRTAHPEPSTTTDHTAVAAFEQALAEHHAVMAVACFQDSFSLQLRLLQVCQVSLGSEVILPVNAPASWQAALLTLGALPVWVDLEAQHLSMDPSGLAAAFTEHTAVVLICHAPGHVFWPPALAALVQEHSCWVIEDATQVPGLYHNHHLPSGTLGDLGLITLEPYGVAGVGVLAREQRGQAKTAQCKNVRQRPGAHPDPLKAQQAEQGLAMLTAPEQDPNRSDHHALWSAFFNRDAALGDWLVIDVPEEAWAGLEKTLVLSTLTKPLLHFLEQKKCRGFQPFEPVMVSWPAFHRYGCQERDFPVAERLMREGFWVHVAALQEGFGPYRTLIQEFFQRNHVPERSASGKQHALP